jgi:hypothetical protein
MENYGVNTITKTEDKHPPAHGPAMQQPIFLTSTYSNMQTREQLQQRGQVITGILKTIGDILQAGPVPAGTLYAGLMQYGCSLQTYQAIEDAFISAGKIRKEQNLLIWIN